MNSARSASRARSIAPMTVSSIVVAGDQLADPGREPALADLADLQPEAAQDAADAQLDVPQLALQQLAPDQQRPHLLGVGGDLRCTGRNQPIRSSWAMPRASLRSVLTTIADSAALTCRVSSSTASKPGPGQAGVQPLRQRAGLQPDPGHRQAEPAEEQATSASGSLATFASRTIRPVGVDHAHAAPFQRHVDPGIVLHGCPSMMPGADPFGPRYTPSL